jgi:hypothetical protein
MTDDPRDEFIDPVAKMVHDLDQYAASASQIAIAMVADHKALVRAGMTSADAAILVGQRWRVT